MHYKHKFGTTRGLAVVGMLSMFSVGNRTAEAQTAPLYVELAQESAAGAGDFDCFPLGVLQVFEASGDATAFYNYNSQSFGGTLTYGAPLEDFSNLFFVKLGDGSVALTWVHDRRGNPTGDLGGTALTRVEVLNGTGLPSRLVSDDPDDDTYVDSRGSDGSYIFAMNHDWGRENTDGAVIGPLAGPWTTFVSFDQVPTNLIAWQIIGPDGGYQIVGMDSGRRVRIRPVQAPATTLLQLLTFDDPIDPLLDVSGTNHHVYQWEGNPSLVAGQSDSGVGLDINNWLRCDLEIGPLAHTAISFGGWVRVDAPLTSTANFIASGTGSGNRDRALTVVLGNDGEYHWALNRQQSSFGGNNINTRVAIGENMFVAAVYDESGGTSGTVKLRVDSTSLNDAMVGLMGTGSVWFGLGGNPAQGGTPSRIVVDNVFVVREALSDARLLEIQQFGYSRIPSCATIFRQPACTCIESGGTMTLTVDAGSTSGVNYLWRKDGVSLGVTQSSLFVPAVSEMNEGVYDVLVTSVNGCGSVLSSPAVVNVRSAGDPACTPCDSIDFNNDTSLFDPQDIEAFLSVYSEGPCVPGTATCGDIDFNNDTSVFDPCDISSFLVVYSEGPCTPCGQ